MYILKTNTGELLTGSTIENLLVDIGGKYSIQAANWLKDEYQGMQIEIDNLLDEILHLKELEAQCDHCIYGQLLRNDVRELLDCETLEEALIIAKRLKQNIEQDW